MEQAKVGRKIFLIRHAESEYNKKVNKLMSSLEGKEGVDTIEETRKIKFQEETIDCSISEKGEKQVLIIPFTI